MAELSRLAALGVDNVTGLSGKRGAALAAAGISTVADLLHHVPIRYLDRTRVEAIGSLPLGREVTVVATVRSIATRRPRRGLTITTATIGDPSGTLSVVWFNQQFRQRQLPVGAEVAFSGTVERYRGRLQMSAPDVDVLSDSAEALTTGRIVPVHRVVGKVSAGILRRAVHNAVRRSRPIPDPIPEPLLRRHELIGRDRAYGDIHFPEVFDDVAPARRRLVFDELFRLEVALALARHRQVETAKGIVHPPPGPLVDQFHAALPYRLTGSQRRVLDDIRRDLESERPMHRLLQGEVGSGKTVVAVSALLQVLGAGRQGAIMAPTEVLAAQHFAGICRLLADGALSPDPSTVADPLGTPSLFEAAAGPSVGVALLTASQVATNRDPAAGRRQVLDWIADGTLQLVIGTHALIQEGVDFQRLGLAVVDEQHRFGAMQRMDLKEKGGREEPDLLIMTATPIPRTLAMTLYGDLDVSTLDELPPGRSPITTRSIGWADQEKAWDAVRAAVDDGHQAFVVCPLVDDSDKVDAASAIAEEARLSDVLAPRSVGLLHGQMPPAEKTAVMEAFRRGEVEVLVSTTVIEVGIDVPNATVMVIEDADRFGLSQLHQLRGRVGRGSHAGTCLLLADPTTPDGERRIAAMVETTDGFRLAEVDLEIRGQGTVFGARQSGLGDLRLADIIRDLPVLEVARSEAFALVADDPRLARHAELAGEIRLLLGEAVEWLFVS